MSPHFHFSSLFVLVGQFAHGNGKYFKQGISSQPRNLSEDTVRLINSRLIFVYDDEGCRELEGMEMQNGDHKHLHRTLALNELERRLDLEYHNRKSLLGASAWSTMPEIVPERVSISTIYLKSLEMEIAQVPDGMSLQDLERLATNLPCVKYISRDDVKFIEDPLYEPGIIIDMEGMNARNRHIAESVMPQDPLYKYQWSLHRGNDTRFGIDAETVWRDWNWDGDPSVTIAIIDSGCNMQHPDLKGQFWRNPGEKDCHNGIDDDGNGLIDDCHGYDFFEEDNDPQAKGTSHGTAAAGIIAARANNREGISGICPQCQLMCLRFISNTEGTVANEVRAIDYAVRMGAKISNNSYGGYAHTGSRVERDAIERAMRQGHLFVASAGNNNIATDTSEFLHTPSGYPIGNIVAVGASTEGGRKTSFSNYGHETVHMFAPGRNIVSTGKDGYLINQGTSFAAPHVAGVAGLVWSRFPELSTEQVVQVLNMACRPSKDLRNLSLCGGVINASSAMSKAEEVWRSPGRVPSWGRTPPRQGQQKEAFADPPSTIAFVPIPLEKYSEQGDKGTGRGNPESFDHHHKPSPIDFAPSSTDLYYDPTQLHQYSNATTYTTAHGGLWAPGIRASSLHSAGVGILPTAKRLIRGPIYGTVDLINAGLDWVPSLSALAQYISPVNTMVAIPQSSLFPPNALAHLAGFAPMIQGSALNAFGHPPFLQHSPPRPYRPMGFLSEDNTLGEMFSDSFVGNMLDGFKQDKIMFSSTPAQVFVDLLNLRIE